MPPGPSRGLPSDLKRSCALRHRADESNSVPSLLGTPQRIRSWALQGPGDGPGKARTTEEGALQGS